MTTRTVRKYCPNCDELLYKPNGQHSFYRCRSCKMEYSEEMLVDEYAELIKEMAQKRVQREQTPKFKSGTAYTTTLATGEFPSYAPPLCIPREMIRESCWKENEPTTTTAGEVTQKTWGLPWSTSRDIDIVEEITKNKAEREEREEILKMEQMQEAKGHFLFRVTLVDRRTAQILFTEMVVAKNREEAAFKIGADERGRETSTEYDDIQIIYERVSRVDLKEEAEPTPVKVVE